MAFVHLHTHTQYSILDSSNKIDSYIDRVKELGMNAAAITDHGNMYGVVEFYQKAKKAGIRPVIGCEVYVAPGSRFEKNSARGEIKYYHLVLLCENLTGYRNLMKLVSIGNMEGFYSKPRVDRECLQKYHEGLIALSACLAGEVSRAANQSYEKAKEVALEHLAIFGEGNYFLEMQDHMDGSVQQQKTNQTVLRLHQDTGIPMVVTNDCHYTRPEDAKAHDVLLCMQDNKTVDDVDRIRYDGGQYYVKSEEEMRRLFPYAAEAIENTQAIADRCDVTFTFNEYKKPQYSLPEGHENQSPKEFLTELIKEGFQRRYGENEHYNDAQRKQIWQEAMDELRIIDEKGFVEYILIVWDYINWANTHNCKTGPGRGSAAGSRVCYCIGITDVDPVRYNLLFERFLNPERVSMPDIDVDFEDSQRLRVINDYIFHKYGRDCVSQITTFQNMKAKAVLKDVGRALGIPFQETNRVSKMIPNELNITLKDALKKNPELRAYAEESAEHKMWFDYAMELEGIPKATGVHAAGVVIYPGRADECMPQGRAKDGTPACEYNMIQLEQLGYLKMDFLGLRTLTVVKDAVANVKKTRGIELDMDHMDYDDPKTLEFIGSGKTSGVFQLESAGMQSFMKELRPSGFEDIIAGISLYRPGPMEFIPSYIKGKDDPEHVVYKCKALEPILKDTYGCIVYQEQVMQIVQQLAGYSLGQADIMRRAMSKKHQDEIDAGRHTFVYGNADEVKEGEDGYVPGCIRNGICDTPEESERVANEIYDSMLDFAKYAFNKSHAASYAVLSMQTAYLKLYYPQEFFAALLTSVIDASGKLAEYLGVCRSMGIEVLPPDVSAGTGEFSVYEGKIKYGMYAVKGVGPVLIDGLVQERERNGAYTSFQNFLERTMPLGVNKRAVENLIKAGALDCFGANRRQMVYGFPAIMDDIAADQKNSLTGQMSLFDLVDEEEKRQYEAKLPEVEEFPRDVLLSFEKEVLGIYVSGHPLEDSLPLLTKNVTLKTNEFLWDEEKQRTQVMENQRGVIGGILLAKTIKFTKSGAAMAFLTIEDLYGSVEVILFPKVFERYRDILQEDSKLLIEGHASVEEDKDAKLIADDLLPFDAITSDVWLRFSNMEAYEEKKAQVEEIIRHSDGMDTMTIYLEDRKAIRRMGAQFSFQADSNILKMLQNLVGEKNVSVVPGTWRR